MPEEIELWMGMANGRWSFFARENDEFLAELTVEPYNDCAVLHCEVHRWSRGLLSVYREAFEDIRAALREEGIRLLIPATTEDGEKMQRFAQLFGFRCLDVLEQGELTVHFAVMEA
jgi:hypothetical protein